MNKFLSLTMTLFIFNIAHAGSGSSVGDGGFGVLCPRDSQNIELLDLYGARELHDRHPNFGKAQTTHEMIKVVLNRFGKTHKLDYQELLLLHMVAARFFQEAESGHTTWDPAKATALPRVRLEPALADRLFKQNCSIVEVGVFFFSDSRYGNMCDTFDAHCLWINKTHWDRMNNQNKAAFIIHEAIRTLPWPYWPLSDLEHRRFTMDLLTGS